MDTACSFIYKCIGGVEDLELYKSGGYHPVMIGNICNDRYEVIDKLGHGSQATVWLAFDDQTNNLVALKVSVSKVGRGRSESEITRELSIPLDRSLVAGIKSSTRPLISAVLDDFEVTGPNGRHPCYVFPLALRDLQSAFSNGWFPIRISRAVSARMTLALLTVHSHGYVHSDVRLPNLLVGASADFVNQSIEQFRSRFNEPQGKEVIRLDKKPLTSNAPERGIKPVRMMKPTPGFTLAEAHAVVLADFGFAYKPLIEPRFGKDAFAHFVNRPPETSFEPEKPMSFPSDIWSLALTLWDLYNNSILFRDHNTMSQTVANQIDLLGSKDFPEEWWKSWEDRSDHFFRDPESGILVRPNPSMAWSSLEEHLDADEQWRKEHREAIGAFFQAEERCAFLHLMRGMLRFRPEDRLTIEEVLQSEWMVKWALPELDQEF